MTDDEAVSAVVAEMERAVGPIDVLGDPAKAAAAVLEVVEAEKPPVHLVLGSDALRLVASGRAAVTADIEAWAELSRSTDFPDGHQLATADA
ncbi:hypothetical protein ACWED2_28020 [Amycolatopsis sp. NPDC005003]